MLDDGMLPSLARLGSVQGGEETLRPMTLNRWTLLIGQKNEADRKSWVSSVWVTRYCPTCLSGDEKPHLRLLWRLHFLPLCPEHGVLLQRACWKCGRTQQLHQFASGESPALCMWCHSSFCKAPAIKPKDCERLIRLASSVAGIANDRAAPLPGADYETGAFSDALRFLMRLFIHYAPKGRSLQELYTAHDLAPAPPSNWRENEAVACVLAEESLRIMEGWTPTTREFVERRLVTLSKDVRYLQRIREAESIFEQDFDLSEDLLRNWRQSLRPPKSR